MMANATLHERLLQNIFLLELLSRVGMSLFFGFAVFGFACLLNIQEKATKLSSTILFLSRGAFLCGAIFILVFGILEFILPMGSITVKLYTASSFIFAVILLFFDSKRKEFPALSFVVSAFIFLLMTLISFLEPKILLPSEKGRWLINFHIILSILGEIFLVVSFCASFLFILNHNKLKRKLIDFNVKSASLSSLEKIIEKSSFLGLAFITLALITGLILVFVRKNEFSVGLVKIFWAFLIWTWYLICIFGRRFWGWKGYKGAWLIILGSTFLMLGLVGRLLI